MTHPTGEHASGVELASGYVTVDVRTHQGTQQLHKDLDSLETHGKQVGENTANNIVTAVSAAGDPASKGFIERLRSGVSSGSKLTADEAAMSFGQTFKDSMQKSRLFDDADWLFHGSKEKSELYGAEAASSFHGRFIQLFAANRMDAEREAEKTGQAVSGALKRGVESGAEGLGIGEAFKKASESMSSLGSKAGEAGEEVGGLGEKLGGIAGPLAAFASPEVLGVGAVLGVVGAVGVLIDKVYKLGASWEETTNALRWQTGASGEQLEALKGYVKGVYDQVDLGKDKIAGIAAQVSTAFRDAGPGIEDVTKHIAELEARGDQVDFTSLGNTFKAFNIAGDTQKQVDVLNELHTASQKTQVPLATLTESMARIAPVANQFHLGVGDVVGVMSQLAQAGINPQNMLFTFSHAAQQASKSGADFTTVLRKEIDEIKNAPTDQAAQQLAKQYFGPTSGRGGAASMVQAIRDGLTLDPAILAQYQNVGDSIDRDYKATDTWGQQWDIFKHKVSDALEPTSTLLHEKVQNVMEGLVSFLTTHQAGITTFVTSIVDGFEKASTAIGRMVKEALPSIKAAIDYLRPDFEAMLPHLKKLGEAFGPMAEAIGKDVVPIVKVLGEGIIWALGMAMKYSGPALDALTAFEGVVKTVADWLHSHFGPAMKEAFGNNKDDVDAIVHGFDDVKKWFNDIKPIIHDVGTAFHDTFSGIADVVKTIVDGLDRGYDDLKKWTDALNNIHLPHLPDLSNPLVTPPARGQTGMALSGYGGGDIVPALLEPGEHVTTKEEVQGVGGHDNMYVVRQLMRHGILRQILGFDDGGEVPFAPWDTGGQPSPIGPSPGTLTGEHHADKDKLEAAMQDYERAGQGKSAAEWGSRGLRGIDRLGQFGSWAGTAAEAAEPFVKTLGLAALPLDALGIANWGLNALGNVTGQPTNLSPTERLQQWWYMYAKSPQTHQDWRPGYQGSTPQSLHIPGTNTSIGGILQGFWNWAQPRRTGGEIHPAGHEHREHSWVLDRFKMAKPGVAHFQGGGLIHDYMPGIGPRGGTDAITGSGPVFPTQYGMAHREGSEIIIIPWGQVPYKFQDGGAVGGYGGLTDVKALLSAESGRTPYNFGGYSPTGIDCSGLVAEAVEIYLGEPMSGGHPMSTGNEASWLAAHGFVQGTGPDGTFRVGFYNGGPGGGHTALTLPDGTNAESGGSGGGVRLGGGAAGANSSEFTEHWYLPARTVVEPGGYGGTGGGTSGGYGGAGGAQSAAYGGGGGGGGGAIPPTPEQTTKYNDDLVKSQDRITAATNRVNEAQAKLDADRANPKKKPEEIAKDEDHLAESKARLAEAESKLQEIQAKPPEGKPGRERGERDGKDDKDQFAGAFGDAAMKAFTDNIPQGFSNPLEWSGVKSASALFKFFGNLLGGSGGEAAKSLVGQGGEANYYAGGGGGAVSPYVQSLMAQVPGYTASGGSSSAGYKDAGTTINRNATFTGDVHFPQDGQGIAAQGSRQILNSMRLVTV